MTVWCVACLRHSPLNVTMDSNLRKQSNTERGHNDSGGWGFYLLKGKPVFSWNLLDLKRLGWGGPEALAPGKHTLQYDFKYDGLGMATLAFNNMSGIGRSGTGVLKVNGKVVAMRKMERTIPLLLQWDETFDVGAGRPVHPDAEALLAQRETALNHRRYLETAGDRQGEMTQRARYNNQRTMGKHQGRVKSGK